MPPRTVTVMLARSTLLIEAESVMVPPLNAVTIAVLTVSPSAKSSDPATCATLRLAESRSTRSPPAGAGAESCTSMPAESPAAISNDGGSTTLDTVRTVSARVAGALTLPNTSLAVAERLSTEPSTALAGTGIWNVSCALVETGETCFAWLTLNAPCPPSATAATPVSSSACAITLTELPGTISRAPVGVRSCSVGGFKSAIGSSTRAALAELPAASTAMASRVSVSPAWAEAGTVNANDVTTALCAGDTVLVCVLARTPPVVKVIDAMRPRS